MNSIVAIHLAALLFSCFVAGLLVGVVVSPYLYHKVLSLLQRPRRDLSLARVICTPLRKRGSHDWNAGGIFTPGALSIRGRTHLLYQALGTDGKAHIGYASSRNGLSFDEQLSAPVFTPPSGSLVNPRMTMLGGRIYVTCSVTGGPDSGRVAAFSIAEHDLIEKHWRWSAPTFLSAPGEMHANWALFPERINGKIAVLQRTAPSVKIAYCDSLEAVGTAEPFLTDTLEEAHSETENSWEALVRSPGPPPIKTKEGWLVFYHAHDAKDRNRLKLGALLLDLHDPRNVIHRASGPVLEPAIDESSAGLISACGAAVREGMLYVYFGEGDAICAAFAPLEPFVKALTQHVTHSHR